MSSLVCSDFFEIEYIPQEESSNKSITHNIFTIQDNESVCVDLILLFL